MIGIFLYHSIVACVFLWSLRPSDMCLQHFKYKYNKLLPQGKLLSSLKVASLVSLIEHLTYCSRIRSFFSFSFISHSLSKTYADSS